MVFVAQRMPYPLSYLRDALTRFFGDRFDVARTRRHIDNDSAETGQPLTRRAGFRYRPEDPIDELAIR